MYVTNRLLFMSHFCLKSYLPKLLIELRNTTFSARPQILHALVDFKFEFTVKVCDITAPREFYLALNLDTLPRTPLEWSQSGPSFSRKSFPFLSWFWVLLLRNVRLSPLIGLSGNQIAALSGCFFKSSWNKPRARPASDSRHDGGKTRRLPAPVWMRSLRPCALVDRKGAIVGQVGANTRYLFARGRWRCFLQLC